MTTRRYLRSTEGDDLVQWVVRTPEPLKSAYATLASVTNQSANSHVNAALEAYLSSDTVSQMLVNRSKYDEAIDRLAGGSS